MKKIIIDKNNIVKNLEIIFEIYIMILKDLEVAVTGCFIYKLVLSLYYKIINNGYIYLYTDNSKIKAFMIIFPIENCLHVSEIFIKKEYRGKNFFKYFLYDLAEIVKNSDYKIISSKVSSKNINMYKIINKLGFNNNCIPIDKYLKRINLKKNKEKYYG